MKNQGVSDLAQRTGDDAGDNNYNYQHMILLNLEKRDTPKQHQLDQNSKDEQLNQPDSVSPDIQTYDSKARHNTEHQIGHEFDVLIGNHFWRLIEKSAYLPGDTNQMPGAECDVSSAFFR